MSKKFEESIQRYFESDRSHLEYLDLAIIPAEKLIKGNIEFYCFEKGKKHQFHSDNSQLNLLADCQYLGLQNLSVLYDKQALLSKIIVKYQKENERKISEIQEKQESLQKAIRKLPSYNQVAELISSIADKPKQIEAESERLIRLLDQRLDQVEHLVKQLTDHLI